MTGRRVWQELVGWLRPHQHEVSVPMGPTGMSRGADAHTAGVETLHPTEAAESELLDFLAGDLDPVPADPAFREELREQCWSLVQDGVTRAKDH